MLYFSRHILLFPFIFNTLKMRENHFFWILKFVLRYTIPIGLTLLYLLLPTTNSGIDGYAYASAIKWGHEPIWPHHLLYVPFGRILFLTFSFVQPLVLMKVVSALAAGVVLVVFQKTLNSLRDHRAHWDYVHLHERLPERSSERSLVRTRASGITR